VLQLAWQQSSLRACTFSKFTWALCHNRASLDPLSTQVLHFMCKHAEVGSNSKDTASLSLCRRVREHLRTAANSLVTSLRPEHGHFHQSVFH